MIPQRFKKGVLTEIRGNLHEFLITSTDAVLIDFSLLNLILASHSLARWFECPVHIGRGMGSIPNACTLNLRFVRLILTTRTFKSKFITFGF